MRRCPDNLFGHWIIDLMKRGTKIISIDPRLSWFASRAEHWLALRPGTDAALAMGFLKVIIDEDLYDHAFLERWTNGGHLSAGGHGEAAPGIGHCGRRFGGELRWMGPGE